MEPLKIAVLRRQLEEQMKSLARSRGFASVVGDRKELGVSLGVAAAGFILGGAVAKDKSAAMRAGLSGFDGVLDGLGGTGWAVCLGNRLIVMPRDSVVFEGFWITWESLKTALADLEREASDGKQLGNIDGIISKLRGNRKLVHLNLPEAKQTTMWTKVKPTSPSP